MLLPKARKLNNKIVFCDNTLWGLLNFRGEVIKSLISDGFDITLIAPDDNLMGKIQLPLDVNWIPIKLNRAKGDIYSDIIYMIKLFYLYRQIKPFCVFHYTIKPNIYGTFIAKILNIKSIVVIAGLGIAFQGNKNKHFVARLLYKFALKMADKVIVLNVGNFNTLIQLNMVKPEKVNLFNFGEGVDIEKYKPQ